MKNLLLIFMYACFSACSFNRAPADFFNSGESNDLLKQVKATKLLNTYDEEACNVYIIEPGRNCPKAKIKKTVDRADKIEGDGSFSLKYNFSGKPEDGEKESVLLEEVWADYRPDLSFCPLGISIWIKGEKGNMDQLRIHLIQDETLVALRDERVHFVYTNDFILNCGDWQRLVIPYSSFKFLKGNSKDSLNLSRFVGYRIEIVNQSGEAHSGEVKIDALEQLTSYELQAGTPQFNSLFIQLTSGYENEDWDRDFKACKDVDIDTWIIQYTQGFGNQNDVSWYLNTKVPWNKIQYPIVNNMVEAAERQRFKLVFGLFGGDYNGDKNIQATYDVLFEKNKLVIDEIYEMFGSCSCFAGWYITEEFHDGSFPDGCWQNNPARDLLADYLQKVAAYCKSKTKKYPVHIAPALFRGKPADLCGEWFKAILKKTPDIDVLYLQDIGGRCLVDVDVDLPNYFTQVKKACDETGVEFGVDIESFKNCWCPDVPYRPKDWEELQDQLFVAGLFTTKITNFSWATFRPGAGAFDEYKKYLKGKW